MMISKRTLIRRHLKNVEQVENNNVQNDQLDLFSEKFFVIYVCLHFNFHCENSIMQPCL